MIILRVHLHPSHTHIKQLPHSYSLVGATSTAVTRNYTNVSGACSRRVVNAVTLRCNANVRAERARKRLDASNNHTKTMPMNGASTWHAAPTRRQPARTHAVSGGHLKFTCKLLNPLTGVLMALLSDDMLEICENGIAFSSSGESSGLLVGVTANVPTQLPFIDEFDSDEFDSDKELRRP